MVQQQMGRRPSLAVLQLRTARRLHTLLQDFTCRCSPGTVCRSAAAASGAATAELVASHGLHPSPDTAAFHQQQAVAGRQEKSGEASQGPSVSTQANGARAPSPALAAAAGQPQSFRYLA